MLIEILRQTSIKGIPARVGELIDVSDADGQYLLVSGKAKEAKDPQLDMAMGCPMPEARKPRTRKPRTQEQANGYLSANP
jgi:hypothetical protein